jgi:LPXTG-site transpeptidase (sortase) family protein
LFALSREEVSNVDPDPGAEPGVPPRKRGLSYGLIAATWIVGGVFLLVMGGFVYWQTENDDAGSWVYLDPNVRTVGDDLVAGASEGPAPLGERQYDLRIESLDVTAPVSPFNADADGTPQVPLEGDIVAWYTFSGKPGNGSNAVYCGHAEWNGAGVFARLPELQAGDQFAFISDDAARVTYSVVETRQIDSSAATVRAWFAPTTYDAATLMTCDGAWYTDASSAEDEQGYVVRGSLVEVKTAD